MGGIIKFIHSEHQQYSFSNSDQIRIQNWRSIQSGRREKEGEVLYIVLSSCLKVFIVDLSIEELHEINYCNKTIKKPFMFSKIPLVCRFCQGFGFIYWIDEMTGNPTNPDNKTYSYTRQNEKFNFDRNPQGEIVVMSDEYMPHDKPYYNSTPYIIEGQMICKYCHGSGLHLTNNYKIQKRIYIENC